MNQRLEVLLVDASATGGTIYGGQQVILALARHAREQVRFTAAVEQPPGAYLDALALAGVEVVQLPLRGSLRTARASLARLLAERRFDLVHTHDLRASALARPVAARRGVPSVTSYQEQLTYAHLSLPARLKRYAMGLVDRQTIGLAAAVMPASRSVARELQAWHGTRLPAERVTVVYNSVDPDDLLRLADHHLAGAHKADGERQVIVVGALVERKGQAVLLRAAPRLLSRVPRVRFVFLGDGPDRARLEALAAELGVAERCWFVGYVGVPAPFVKCADVAVVPSLGEAFGITAAEAMALGTPVVASHVDGLAEVVTDGESGLLVPPGDPDALAAALERVLSEPALAQRLSAGGVRTVAERFTSAAMAAAMVAVYRRVV